MVAIEDVFHAIVILRRHWPVYLTWMVPEALLGCWDASPASVALQQAIVRCIWKRVVLETVTVTVADMMSAFESLASVNAFFGLLAGDAMSAVISRPLIRGADYDWEEWSAGSVLSNRHLEDA